MSISRKKIKIEELNLSTIAQKSRRQHCKSQFKRNGYQKQNQSSRQIQVKMKDDHNKSSKKKSKKKFIQQQIDKMIKKRYKQEQQKLKVINQNGNSQIETLKYDVQEMKNVISKLSIEELYIKENALKEIQNSNVIKRKLKYQDYHHQGIQLQGNFHKQSKSVLYNQPVSNKQQNPPQNLSQQNHNQQTPNQQQQHIIAQLQLTIIQLKSSINSHQKKIVEDKTTIDSLLRQITDHKYQLKERQEKLQQITGDRDRLIGLVEQILNNKIKIEQQLNQLTIKYNKLLNIPNTSQDFTNLNEKQMDNQSISPIKLSVITNPNSTKCQYQSMIASLEASLKMTQIQLQHHQQTIQNYSQMHTKFTQLQQTILQERQTNQSQTIQTKNCVKEINLCLTNLTTQKNNLHTTLCSLKDKYNYLNQSLQRLKCQNIRLFQDKVKLSRQIKHKEENNKQLSIELRCKDDVIVQLRKQIRNKEDFIKQLQIKINDHRTFISQLQEKSTKKTIQHKIQKDNLNIAFENTLQQKDEAILNIKKQSQQIIRQLQLKLEKLSQQIRQQGQKKKQLQKYEVNLRSIISQKCQEVQRCRKQINRMQLINVNTFNNSEKMQQEFKLLQINCKQSQKVYKAHLQASSIKIQQLQTEISKNILTISQFQTQNKKAQQTRQQLQKQISTIKQDNKHSSTLLQQSNQQNQLLTLANNNLQSQLQHCKTATKQLQKQLQHLNSKYHKLQAQLQIKVQLLQNGLKDRQILQVKICQLKNIISFIKVSSLEIKQEVDEYKVSLEELGVQREVLVEKSLEQERILLCLEKVTKQQVKYLRERLQWLMEDKVVLQKQLITLNDKYTGLTMRYSAIEQQQKAIAQNFLKVGQNQQLKLQLHLLSQQKQHLQSLQTKQKHQFQQQLNLKQKSLQMIKLMIQEQRVQFKSKLNQLQSHNVVKDDIKREENNLINYYRLIVEEKDQEIKKLNERIQVYQVSKNKVVLEVRQIQNSIEEMADKSNSLEMQKKSLEDEVVSLAATISQLKEEASVHKKRSELLEQRHKTQLTQLSKLYQQKKNDLMVELHTKIKQLTTALQSTIHKLNSKNIQLQQLSLKHSDLQQLLQQNHELLLHQKQQTQKFTNLNLQLNKQISKYKEQHYHHVTDYNQYLIQVEKYKKIIHDRQKQIEEQQKDLILYGQQRGELENKCGILKRKNQHLEHARECLEREVQNREMAIKVMKEENKNVQKVMAEQIAQRNAIIQQLVHEKRMLYSQLNNE